MNGVCYSDRHGTVMIEDLVVSRLVLMNSPKVERKWF